MRCEQMAPQGILLMDACNGVMCIGFVSYLSRARTHPAVARSASVFVAKVRESVIGRVSKYISQVYSTCMVYKYSPRVWSTSIFHVYGLQV
jgi:hypothetical protein